MKFYDRKLELSILNNKMAHLKSLYPEYTFKAQGLTLEDAKNYLS